MKVRLLETHVIGDFVFRKGDEIDLGPGVKPTVMMTPLDEEAAKAIAEHNTREWPDTVERGMLKIKPD